MDRSPRRFAVTTIAAALSLSVATARGIRSDDCNANGIDDLVEVAESAELDRNENGVPDGCEEGPIFYAEIEPVADVGPTAPEYGQVEFRVWLHTVRLPAGEPGAQGWVMSIETGGCQPGWATFDGTTSALVTDEPPGLVDVGFRALRGFHPDAAGNSNGFSAAVILSFTQPITLDPGDGPHLVLRVFAEVSDPQAEDCARCAAWLSDSEFAYPQGGVNEVVYQGSSHPLHSDPGEARICFAPFHRGDATGDGALDVSDGVRIVSHLFLGADAPPCLEAADSNDDGNFDIADAIYGLSFLFTGGPPPPEPGPPGGKCGFDPLDSPRSFPCDEYAGCS
jgi:hypothetical protein